MLFYRTLASEMVLIFDTSFVGFLNTNIQQEISNETKLEFDYISTNSEGVILFNLNCENVVTRSLIQKESIKNNSLEQTQFKFVVIEVILVYV